MPNAPPSIAVTSTLAMVRAAEARGFDTADLLAAASVPRELLEDPDARLPGATVLALWGRLRERAADPVLQLAAPANLPFGAYRVIDYIVAASTTVGEGIGRFARFFRLIADAVELTIEEGEEERRLCLAMSDGGCVPPVYVDYIFAALVARIRMRIRPGLAVLRLELRQSEPPASAAYGEFFRARVDFGSSANRLCFSRNEWNAPMDTADAALALLLEEHARILTQRAQPGADSFRNEVQKTIASLLPERSSVSAVAEALHMSVRTLQRKLIASGTTFRELSGTVRQRLAAEYLADRNVSTAEVAFMLGFADQSSFNRAFRRWRGEPPGRWRRFRA